MKKEKKIIIILSHEPTNLLFNEDLNLDEMRKKWDFEYSDIIEKIRRVFFFREDFHHIIGKLIKNKYHDIKVECWRPYSNKIKNIYEKDIDGIKHRLFPYKKLIITFEQGDGTWCGFDPWD